MAASLLELVIPASVSIVVACSTVIWTTISNRKLERKKILSAKREEIFIHCEDFLQSLSSVFYSALEECGKSEAVTKENSNHYFLELNKLENKSSRINGLCKMHFNEISEECEKATREVVSVGGYIFAMFLSHNASHKNLSPISHEEYDIDGKYKSSKYNIKQFQKKLISIKVI